MQESTATSPLHQKFGPSAAAISTATSPDFSTALPKTIKSVLRVVGYSKTISITPVCLTHPRLPRPSCSDLLTSHVHQASRPLRVSPVFVLRVLAAVSTSLLTWIRLYFDPLLSYLTLSRFARLLCALSNRVSLLLLGLAAPHQIQGMRVDPNHSAAVPTSL